MMVSPKPVISAAMKSHNMVEPRFAEGFAIRAELTKGAAARRARAARRRMKIRRMMRLFRRKSSCRSPHRVSRAGRSIAFERIRREKSGGGVHLFVEVPGYRCSREFVRAAGRRRRGTPKNRGSLEMRRIIAALIADETGATAIEYGLIAAGISIAIIVAVNGLGTTLNGVFTSVNTQLR